MIINEKTNDKIFEVSPSGLTNELSRFFCGVAPTGGTLVIAKDRHTAFLLYNRWKNGARYLMGTYYGYKYPIKNVIFDT